MQLVIIHKSVRPQLHCGRGATVQLSPNMCAITSDASSLLS